MLLVRLASHACRPLKQQQNCLPICILIKSLLLIYCHPASELCLFFYLCFQIKLEFLLPSSLLRYFQCCALVTFKVRDVPIVCGCRIFVTYTNLYARGIQHEAVVLVLPAVLCRRVCVALLRQVENGVLLLRRGLSVHGRRSRHSRMNASSDDHLPRVAVI